MTDYLKGFLYRDEESCIQKINSFIKSGKDKIYLLLDFDRTLTKSRNKFGENVTTWEILQHHLPQNARRDYSGFYHKYRPLEIDNKLKETDAIEWWESILTLFKNNNLRWLDIATDVEEKMPIRPYVQELFRTCEEKSIPLVIISAGIKDVIELWCQKFEVNPTIVLATNLLFSPDGYIEGWDRESLIHVLNKKEKGHEEVSQLKRARPNVILLGDSKDDAFMVEGSDNILRVFIDEARVSESLEKNEDYYNDILRDFDLILKGESLLPLVEIINNL